MDRFSQFPQIGQKLLKKYYVDNDDILWYNILLIRRGEELKGFFLQFDVMFQKLCSKGSFNLKSILTLFG